MIGGTSSGAPLEVAALSKRYGRNRPWALREIDLTVPVGSATAIIGPNGAGKSTLLRCMMGFEAPTSGRVRVRGIDPWRRREAALQHVGYVGQDAVLYRDLSVDDHLGMAAAFRRDFDITSAHKRLADLEIPRTARAGELSGGQRAQVALAVALATHAPILLLDEPIASLDPLARLNFFSVLSDAIRSEGPTILLSSHIVGDLAMVCDSIVVLAPARIVLHATLAAALAQHRLIEADKARARHPARIISTFRRPDRTEVSLVQVDQGGDVTIDDLVLGYLAARKAPLDAAAQ